MGVDDQGGLGADVGRAPDPGQDAVAIDAHRALENAADQAFLPPDLARGKLAIVHQAGELGACAGAAGGAVISLARAEDEVLAIRSGTVGGPNSSMWSISPSWSPVMPCAVSCLANAPGDLGEAFGVLQGNGLAVVLHQEEPVAAPGDVADIRPQAGNVDGDMPGRPVAGHVVDRHVVVVFERERRRCRPASPAGAFPGRSCPGGPASRRGRWSRGRTCPGSRRC